MRASNIGRVALSRAAVKNRYHSLVEGGVVIYNRCHRLRNEA